MAELKPCPFCGGKAGMLSWRIEKLRINPTSIHCNMCGAQTMLHDNQKSAIEAWDRRAEDGK